ncbi:MAG: sigma-E factor negative regulatory protein [Pseudomonadota bacterium]
MTREEEISALMDGELDGRQRDVLLDAMARAGEDADRWERYHLIRDALHNELPERLDIDLAGRVRTALENEPTVLAPHRGHRLWRRWGTHVGRQVAGFAVAATVAVAVVSVAWQPDGAGPGPAGSEPLTAERGDVPGGDEGSRLAAAPPEAGSSRVASGGNSAARGASSGTGGGGSALERYMINHSEYSSSASVQGMLPYMRVVGHSAESGGTEGNGRR